MRFTSASAFLLFTGLLSTVLALPVVDARAELESVGAFQARKLNLEIRGYDSPSGESLLSRASPDSSIAELPVITWTGNSASKSLEKTDSGKGVLWAKALLEAAKAAGIPEFLKLPSPLKLQPSNPAYFTGTSSATEFLFKWKGKNYAATANSKSRTKGTISDDETKKQVYPAPSN